MESPEKKEIRKYLIRFSNRIMRGHSAYLLWKSIKIATNITDVGNQRAEENATTMNLYEEIFPAIIFSLETTFIIELHKFFDTSKEALKLIEVNTSSAGIAKSVISKEDKKNIENLVLENKQTIDHIKELRHQLFAHDKIKKEGKFLIPPTNNLDKLFDVVKEIHNIISKSTTGDFYVWADKNGNSMKSYFNELIINLQKGREQRIKEEEEEWVKKYGK